MQLYTTTWLGCTHDCTIPMGLLLCREKSVCVGHASKNTETEKNKHTIQPERAFYYHALLVQVSIIH